MPYYHTCRLCGAHLDPGERCDCEKERPADVTAPTSQQPKDSTIIPRATAYDKEQSA